MIQRLPSGSGKLVSMKKTTHTCSFTKRLVRPINKQEWKQKAMKLTKNLCKKLLKIILNLGRKSL